MSEKKNFFQKAREIADKVIDGAEKGADKAKVVWEDVTEPIKLEWKIAELKNKLEALLLEYGEVCYYGSDDENKIEVVAKKIADVENELEPLLEHLKEIKYKCQSKSKSVYCTECGTEYKKGEKYCYKCGSNLKK